MYTFLKEIKSCRRTLASISVGCLMLSNRKLPLNSEALTESVKDPF